MDTNPASDNVGPYPPNGHPLVSTHDEPPLNLGVDYVEIPATWVTGQDIDAIVTYVRQRSRADPEQLKANLLSESNQPAFVFDATVEVPLGLIPCDVAVRWYLVACEFTNLGKKQPSLEALSQLVPSDAKLVINDGQDLYDDVDEAEVALLWDRAAALGNQDVILWLRLICADLGL